ncbi:MAG TPA: Ig-like domain-containing protein, partial [Gaiellaceae bacterium]|nr:Ig-like domain-containing protein [Gaiellaceae bacterium]
MHSLSATQTLVAAVTSDYSAAVSVTVYPPPPAAPTIGASTTATTSTSVTLSGSGVTGDTITLYDGTTAIATTTVVNGSWTLTPTGLALGAHTFSATQTDPVWNFTSVKSSTVTVTIYAPPPPPVINAGPAIGTVIHSAANVTFTGTGVAGHTITLYDGTTNVGTVTVASNGTWTLTVKLASGTHTITATDTQTAGVTSAPSAAVTVVVPSH